MKLQVINSWGAIGHKIVASVAESYLMPNANNKISNILRNFSINEGKQYLSIVDIATYADDIRFQQSWSSPFHFININSPFTKYDEASQCMPPNYCIVKALNNYTSILNNSTITDPKLMGEALAFTVHLFGDVHQPLHTGNLGDLGGNKIALTLSKDWKTSVKTTNLHSLWDTLFFQHWMSTEELQNDLIFAKFKSYIEDNKSKIKNYFIKLPNIIAVTEESRFICETDIYAATRSFNLSDLPIQYFSNSWPIAQNQIIKAGIRLAAVLNEIFDYPTEQEKNSSRSSHTRFFIYYFILVAFCFIF